MEAKLYFSVDVPVRAKAKRIFHGILSTLSHFYTSKDELPLLRHKILGLIFILAGVGQGISLQLVKKKKKEKKKRSPVVFDLFIRTPKR